MPSTRGSRLVGPWQIQPKAAIKPWRVLSRGSFRRWVARRKSPSGIRCPGLSSRDLCLRSPVDRSWVSTSRQSDELAARGFLIRALWPLASVQRRSRTSALQRLLAVAARLRTRTNKHQAAVGRTGAVHRLIHRLLEPWPALENMDTKLLAYIGALETVRIRAAPREEDLLRSPGLARPTTRSFDSACDFRCGLTFFGEQRHHMHG